MRGKVAKKLRRHAERTARAYIDQLMAANAARSAAPVNPQVQSGAAGLPIQDEDDGA